MQSRASEMAGPFAGLATRLLLGAAALLALALTVPAEAASRGKDKDPRRDFTNHSSWPTKDVDIVKIKHRERGGTLKHVVKLDGRAPHPRPRDNEPSPPWLAIDTGPGGGEAGCSQLGVDATGAEYVVASIARSKPRLVDCATGESKRVKVKKQGRHKVVYKLKRWKIDRPRKYGWRAETAGFDVAPNGSRWLNHRLNGGNKGNGKGKRWKKCGDLQEQGAGAYDVRAKRTGCPMAKRVANHWVWEGGFAEPNKKWRGWKCRSKQIGYELHKAKCTKRKKGRKKKVKFEYGA